MVVRDMSPEGEGFTGNHIQTKLIKLSHVEAAMRIINIHEAKTQLSRLVEQAARGEGFIIAKAGKPLVKVMPIEVSDGAIPRRLGFLAGEITVPDDFDSLGRDEVERLFGDSA
jgi:prevent-host-death family protein